MKVLIVEDELIIAKQLQRMLVAELGQTISTINHCLCLDDAEDWLAANTIDLLILDLNLNGSSGFELLKRAVAQSFQTIIVSANTDQAINAFEYGVLDFIAKPFNQSRLATALARLSTYNNLGTRYLAIKKFHKIELINIAQISHIKAAGNYSEVMLDNDTNMLHEKNLEKLNRILPDQFVRIHKSYIVNIKLAKEIISYTGSKYELLLNNGTRLPIGRTRLQDVRSQLGLR